MKKTQLREIIKEEIQNLLEGNSKQDVKEIDIWETVPKGRLYKIVVIYKNGKVSKYRKRDLDLFNKKYGTSLDTDRTLFPDEVETSLKSQFPGVNVHVSEFDIS
tara:strand:- start:494 stop:805 length:312 start_codon:yes stop_codon:yes gene_type:complete